MTSYQLKQLSKIKRLVYSGKRKFLKRKDRDYILDLLDLGIDEENAWKEIMNLSKADYWYDDRSAYIFEKDKALVFKKSINGNKAYIKVKLEINKDDEMTVCISFHKDIKRGDNNAL